jgi:hypothetical protein
VFGRFPRMSKRITCLKKLCFFASIFTMFRREVDLRADFCPWGTTRIAFSICGTFPVNRMDAMMSGPPNQTGSLLVRQLIPIFWLSRCRWCAREECHCQGEPERRI